jgi:hypothetical protein
MSSFKNYGKKIECCYWNDELAQMPIYASKNSMPIYASNLIIFKVQELNYELHIIQFIDCNS